MHHKMKMQGILHLYVFSYSCSNTQLYHNTLYCFKLHNFQIITVDILSFFKHRLFGFLAPKDFYIIWLLNILAWSVPDESYGRNFHFEQNISTIVCLLRICQSISNINKLNIALKKSVIFFYIMPYYCVNRFELVMVYGV